MNITELLNSYPRTRPELTDKHKGVYAEEYKLNRSDKTLLFRAMQFLETWHHRNISRVRTGDNILELGSGTLNHVQYEHDFSIYDCIEPFRYLYEDSPYKNNITHMYEDIRELGGKYRYDRIISIAVLEHLIELPYVVCKCALLMKDGGLFQASIPSEGGFLWGLSWRMTTGISYRFRTGLNYKTVMRHEHINSAREIELILAYFFKSVTIKRFPFFIRHLSIYTYIEASDPIISKCVNYLEMNKTLFN